MTGREGVTVSNFDAERSWATWWHRLGRKSQGTGQTAKQRAQHVRNSKAARDANKSKGSGDQGKRR